LVPKVPKRQRRSKAQQRAESLEQILDAAEYLFSKHGLYGVTLRDVAQRVGIHTTLLHYYFEDKRNLFEAVFARRAGVTRAAASPPSSSTKQRQKIVRPLKAHCTHF
jgi:AcrR family transcriptional regulator